MTEDQPRFEFRAFARNFGIVETNMRRLARCEQIRESGELYIMSAGSDDHNTKIRDDKLDIKALVRREHGLEQWSPRLKERFPLPAAVVREGLFPAFGLAAPELRRAAYTLEECLEDLVWPHSQLVPVEVNKRRFSFTIEGCIAEFAEVWVNGAGIQTVAVESADAEAVLRARMALALEAYENVSYLKAIKRIIGMHRLPHRGAPTRGDDGTRDRTEISGEG